MALTPLQHTICQLIAGNRIASGESYVAGGVALNELIGAPRISRDLDLFHDTDEALDATWHADRALLEKHGFEVRILRERASFVEAEIVAKGDRVRLEWARDSSYRFFPPVSHDILGLALHPFDLATNKVLALVGRLEVRGWIDVIESHDLIQPLGYLAWAACAKDPGFSPGAILEEAARSGRYSADEIGQLDFVGGPPDAKALSRKWRQMLKDAREIIMTLPPEEIGTCVLTTSGAFCRATTAELREAISRRALVFHRGSIRGALPRIVEP